MTVQPKRKQALEIRLNDLIAEMEYHKQRKYLSLNYYVVLQEMKNLRNGVEIGN